VPLRPIENVRQKHLYQTPRVGNGLRDRFVGVAVLFRDRFGSAVAEERVPDAGIDLHLDLFVGARERFPNALHVVARHVVIVFAENYEQRYVHFAGVVQRLFAP
jgi:hypothetical protein